MRTCLGAFRYLADVYGRSKAYESIIKGTEIVGPKVPESFNVLVKELQGLSLKVDLMSSNEVIDAEKILAANIKDEAAHQPEVDVPKNEISALDMSEDVVQDEFAVMGLADKLPGEPVSDDPALVAAEDNDHNKASTELSLKEEI